MYFTTEFLSTPSARRATPAGWSCRSPKSISIHALREEGDDAAPELQSRADEISIHALREEGDASSTPTPAAACHFYPRPPRGGRRDFGVSELDYIQFLSTPSARRATSSGSSDTISVELFLSTPSARRATFGTYLLHPSTVISIHALREEGDNIRR